MSGGAGKLAIFNLPDDTREDDLQDLFGKFGRLSRCVCRNTRSGGVMAFVEFDDVRDAEDAKRDRHGYSFGSRRLRVEFSNPPGKGGKRDDSRGRPSGKDKGKGKGKGYGKRYDSRRRDSRGRGDFKGKGKGSGGKGIMREDYFKVKVVGIPEGSSWQDAKDFLRKAGAVKFADIDPKDRTVAIGGFDRREDMERALDELHDSDFRSRDGETTRVTVEEDRSGGGGRDRSAPRSRGRDRSRDRSGERSPPRDRSRGRSRSPPRDRSR